MEKNNKTLNVPHLRFPEFSGEWVNKRMTDIAPLQRGFDLPTQEVEEGEYPVVYSNGILRYHKTYKCEAPGLVTGRSGSIGSFTFIGEGKYWPHNTSLWVTDFNKNHPLFIYYLYQTINISQYASGSSVPTLNRNDVHRHSTNIPSLNEQIKIAALLEKIDKRIDTQKKIIEDLKKLKDAIIHSHYRNELSHSPMAYIGQYITQVSKRNKDARIDRVLSVSNKYGFINQDEQFEDREVASADTSNYKVVHKGDFAYNPARINVGSVARLQEFENGIVSPMYVCFTAKKGLLPAYFELYLSTNIFKHEMNKRLEGSVRLCLTYEGLCNIKIALPEFNVQKDFVSKVSRILTKIKAEERLLYLYQNCKQYLLTQLFI